MANITLNTNGSVSGTGSLNPVPASFGPVTGTLALTVLVPTPFNTNQINAPFPLLTVQNLNITWENNTLTAAANIPVSNVPYYDSIQPFNFIQYVNPFEQPPLLNGLAALGIPNIAFPDFLLGKILITVVTIAGGTFQIITSQ